MLFGFARISAVLSLKRQDFYYQGPRRWLRFHEKGGKEHEMPAHHEIEETIDEYLSKVSIDDKQPLFQSVNKAGTAHLLAVAPKPEKPQGEPQRTSPASIHFSWL